MLTIGNAAELSKDGSHRDIESVGDIGKTLFTGAFPDNGELAAVDCVVGTAVLRRWRDKRNGRRWDKHSGVYKGKYTRERRPSMPIGFPAAGNL